MFISASRIKSYLTCSYAYDLTYNKGFRGMDEGNDGSRRGTICHLILELIQRKKSRHHMIDGFPKDGYIGFPSIRRLVQKHARIVGVDDDVNMGLMESFIKVGLKTDFLCKGWDLQDPEKKFEIENESPFYRIMGFVDKSAISYDGKACRIDDYKTSKAKFTGKDKSFNIQAFMYALAMMKLGNFKDISVNFIFLKFPKAPLQSFDFSQPLLRGFEIYLSNIYKYLSNFNKKKACANFAKNNENYFLCGKEPGDLKADGSPAWVCPWKRGFVYWEIKNADGKIITTAKTKEKALDKMEDGFTMSEKYYPGCLAWANR